jgi:hypothetical protein
MAVAFDIDAAMKRKINKAKKENGPQSRNHFKTPQDTNNAEPAFSIVKSLGGVRAVARELECSPGTVTRWCTPKSRDTAGGDGRIPAAKHDALIALADKLGVRGVKSKLRLM